MIKQSSFALLALAAALAISPAAKADDFTFTFTDSTSGLSASGELDGINEGGGVWLIDNGGGNFTYGPTSGSFSVIANPSGPAFSSLSPSGYFGYDDLLTPLDPSGAYVDGNGLLFDFDGVEVDMYYYLGAINWADNNGDAGIGTFTITSSTVTPEPGTWMLLLTGMALLATLVARSRRTPAAVLAA
jgi:hypothetical protein